MSAQSESNGCASTWGNFLSDDNISLIRLCCLHTDLFRNVKMFFLTQCTFEDKGMVKTSLNVNLTKSIRVTSAQESG